MIQHSIPYLPGQVQPFPILLQPIHHPDTLLKMSKSFRADLIQRRLTRMPERRMSEIMSQRNRLHQILIQFQCLRDRPRRLRHLQRMRQPGPIMIPLRRQKHLRLILEPPKRLRMNNPIPVSLINRPDITLLLHTRPSLRLPAVRSIWTQILILPFFCPFPDIQTHHPFHYKKRQKPFLFHLFC